MHTACNSYSAKHLRETNKKIKSCLTIHLTTQKSLPGWSNDKYTLGAQTCTINSTICLLIKLLDPERHNFAWDIKKMPSAV